MDYGQKYHFLRIKRDSFVKAYGDAVQFIQTNAAKWIELTIRRLNNPSSVLNLSHWHDAIEGLAKALHCLQDSFSPAHTARSNMTPKSPGIITDIHVYEDQDKSQHSHKDYLSGSKVSTYCTHAINATVELLELCVIAVSKQYYIIREWENFREKWLTYKV